MDHSEERRHSFIIRIWREEREIERATPLWKGLIEHVPSGRRRYFHTLAPMIAFILPYIEELGLRPGLLWRLMASLGRPKGARFRPASHSGNQDKQRRGDPE